MDDGSYLVFVEIDRTSELPSRIMILMEDLMNLTEQSLDEWRLRYQSSKTDHELSEESIASLVPTSSEDYKRKYGAEEIDKLKTAAGVKVDTKAPKNDFTESLRVAAGII